ncbi:hypothetical protein RRG08_058211 [Elysia crispata]|uniref:Uncharacterized protein n=1 Tax=Elysia crispata TaxID=231223 RepID=A0AAE1CZV2_9GAST|nr:hypothetical protein RRG08_058211 [Elysia crispata]
MMRYRRCDGKFATHRSLDRKWRQQDKNKSQPSINPKTKILEGPTDSELHRSRSEPTAEIRQGGLTPGKYNRRL